MSWTDAPSVPNRFIGLALLLPIALATTVSAQTPVQPSYTLKTSTSIVLLDIVVTDKSGKVVTNLKKDDFTVTEDGVPQTIRSFATPQEHELPASRGMVVRSTADLAKIGNAPVTLLVLDELNTKFEDMSYSRTRMEKYLNSQPPILPQPTTLLVVDNTKFTVLQDYTQDRAALLTALHKHFPEIPWRVQRAGQNGPVAMELLSMSLNSLYHIAQASVGTPGRKTVIWVGQGFPSVNLLTLDDKSQELMGDAMKRLTATMLKSRMTLYTIDPTVMTSDVGGIETAEDLDTYESNNDGQPYADEIKFSTLAPVTGGRAFFARNDIDAEVATSVADGANYYTISYSPSNKSDDPAKYRQIRVHLKDPNLLAATRDGYYAEPPGAAPDGTVPAGASPKATRATLEAEMGQAALSTIIYNGLTTTVEPNGPGKYKLGIEVGGLHWDDTPDGKTRAEITVIAVSFSGKDKDKVGKHISQELSATVNGRISNPSLKAVFHVAFDPPPGTNRIRFVARDAVTGKIGTVDLTP